MAVPPLVSALLDALEEPALLVSGQRTLGANRAAKALLGRQVVGQDVRFAIRQPQALGAILSRRSGRMEVRGIGGVERAWAVSVSVLDDDLLMVRLSDRSAERAAERAKIDFVANASHELRTPLAAVLGYAETLAEPGELEEPLRRRFGQQIHDQARRMMGIVRDLMSLSRIEADRFVEPRDPLSLASIVGDAVDAANALSPDCTVEAELDADLPPIRGDQAQVRQVVDNLLHNALRYGCVHGEGRILVQLSRDGAWQRLCVRDFGDGIAAKHIPRLTERFYRVDSARSRDSGGTGLGLAIVKQVVERHRGRLDIRSSPGAGTEVTVHFMSDPGAVISV